MSDLKLGVSYPQRCHYLEGQEERLLFTLPDQPISMALYQQLIGYNFRRSGDQLYTTYCDNCRACQSVRLDLQEFSPSRSQRRLWQRAKAAGWSYRLSAVADEERYYPLYQRYIESKHRDGSMYPPSPEQMRYLWQSQWQQVMFLEQYQHQTLVGVTVVDMLSEQCSAVYSFYCWPHKLSLGQLAILALADHSLSHGIRYLYLGYYVADCAKMNYKDKFRPQQRFIAGKWHHFG
ncbi:arginyltransferase [Rheinheimera sp.]|uniref:arginyltransferase n=1 Tax=Rheinheimera sp. TaxID=1869214 RepID=UPI00307E149E